MTTPDTRALSDRIREHTNAVPGHQCAGLPGQPCGTVLFIHTMRCLRCQREHERLEQGARREAA